MLQPVAKKYDISKIFLFGSYTIGEDSEEAIGKKVDLITIEALEENITESVIRLKYNIDLEKIEVYTKEE